MRCETKAVTLRDWPNAQCTMARPLTAFALAKNASMVSK
jgi:hypothetical protein